RALRVGRAARVGAGARFLDVAGAGRGPADDGRRREEIGRAVVGDPVAALGDVAVPGDGAALGRALHVGWAARIAAGAVLLDVARTSGRATDRVRRLELTGRRAAVAVDQVAIVPLPPEVEHAVAACRERGAAAEQPGTHRHPTG